MSQKLQPIRGMHDLLFEDATRFERVINEAKQIAALYHYRTAHTPIVEETEVFARPLGETSDVVNKEMYSFNDRNNDSLTLRPEFTAGVVRAFISNGLQQHLPLKLFSYGPLFRYERPQKGRQRQFHQVNFESFGIDKPWADVELIAMCVDFLKRLGIEKGLTVALNSLGDSASRHAYREALVTYLSKYKNDLSEDSKTRFERNPMRILDSKDEKDKAIIADAPKLEKSLNTESQQFFNAVINGLQALGLGAAIKVNPHIVRGFDYYSHTVFECIMDSDLLGSQSTVMAGGRYDGLVELMGGPATPAVGCAAGIERLMLLLTNTEERLTAPVAVLPWDESFLEAAQKIAMTLRSQNRAVEIIAQGQIGKRLGKADKIGAEWAIILAPDEWKNNKVNIKNLKTGAQETISVESLINVIN